MRITISKRVAVFLSLVIFCLILIYLLEIFRIHFGQNLTDALQTIDGIVGIILFGGTIVLWIVDYFEVSQIPTGIKSFEYMFPEMENESPKLLREPFPFRVDFEKNYVVLPKNICSLLVKKLEVKFKKPLKVTNNTETKKKLSQAVIAGPSGCGKTTTSLRFANDLSSLGWKVYYADASQALNTNLITEIKLWFQTLRSKNLLIIDNVHTKRQEAILLLDAIEQLLQFSSLRFRTKIRVLYIETIAHTVKSKPPTDFPKTIGSKRVAEIQTETGTQVGFELTSTYSPKYEGLLGRKPGILISAGEEIAHTLFQRFLELGEIEEDIDFDDIFNESGNIAEFCEVLRWIENSIKDDSKTPTQMIPPNLPQFTLNRHLDKVQDRELGALCLGFLSFFSRMGSVVLKDFIEEKIGQNIQIIVDDLVESQLIREIFVGPSQKQFLIFTHQTIAQLIYTETSSSLRRILNLDEKTCLETEIVLVYLKYLQTIHQSVPNLFSSTFLFVLSIYSAENEIEKLIEILIDSINPPDSNIVYCLHNLSAYFLKKNKLDDAEKAIRQALDIDYQFYQGRSNLGLVLSLKGELEKARIELEISLSQNRNPSTISNLSGILWDLGDGKEAIALMKNALELEPTTARFLFQLGMMQYETAESEDIIDEAISNMRKAIQTEPDEDSFYAGLSYVLIAKQRYPDAELVISEAASRNLVNASLLNSKGIIMQNRGDEAEAFQLYKRALLLDPSFALPHLNLSSYYLNQGKIEESSFHLLEANKTGDVENNANFHVLNGQLFHRQGKFKESIEPFEKAINLGFEKAEIYLNLSIVYYEIANMELAKQNFIHAVKIMCESSKLYFQYLSFILSKGNKSLVVEYVSDIPYQIRKANDYIEILEAFVIMLLKEGLNEIAEICLDQLVQEKPESFSHWLNLGATSLRLKKHTKAKEATIKALELEPENYSAWHNLARAYEELGEIEDSKKAFEKSRILVKKKGDNQLIFDPDKGWHVE